MDTKKTEMNRLMTLFVLLITGEISLTEDKIQSIIHILVSSMAPSVSNSPLPRQIVHGETVSGMAELARILGVSMPTACKINKTGKFDSARLDFGTRKFVWDKARLIEIARKK